MAVLQVLKGDAPGTLHALRAGRTVIGRHPTCHVVLNNGAVSRHHAQVLESHGNYFLEDLRSRNGTFLNGEALSGRAELKEGDEVRICDLTLAFSLNAAGATPLKDAVEEQLHNVRETLLAQAEDAGLKDLDESQIYILPEQQFSEPAFETPSSVLRKLDSRPGSSSGLRTGVRPELKLKALLELTTAVARELDVDAVLPKLLQTLFNLFPQAEQGFVLLREDDSDVLRVKATKTRSTAADDVIAVSMTVIRHVMKSGEAVLSANVLDDSRFKGSTALAKMRVQSMICVPLLNELDEPFGIIQILTRSTTQVFTEEDLDLLVSLAAQAAMAIDNARLHQELLAKRELERDLDFATQVQMGFLPKSRPQVPGYAFSDYYEAALRVGGDYFDYIHLPDGRLAMAIGDVAGKGMPAALLMARLYSSTRFQLLTSPTPAKAVAGLNQEIVSSGLGHRFVTFLVMILDTATHVVTLVNAGHLTPIIRRRNGTVEVVPRDSSGLPLGIVPELEYEETQFQLEPGDTVLTLTDGVTEAMTDRKEIYGKDRLLKLIAKTPGPVDTLLAAIVDDVETFTDGSDSRDDTCLVAAQRLPT
ncbi:MAG: SpoIIE family protein phosphatase [Planctomyces sp.]|nr:SpoIIE family protein phosphatase [Planctomyces sp.]